MLDAPARPALWCAEVEDRDMILVEVHLLAQRGPKSDELLLRQVADVDRVLQAITVVDHDIVDAPKSPGAADVVRHQEANAFGHVSGW